MTNAIDARLIETALIELQYVAADMLFSASGSSDRVQACRLAHYYQTACIALEIAIDVIEDTKASKNKTSVA